MMITINDIAQALNLSTATVSNALTGKGRVSEANRQAIIDKANEMGYDFGRLRLTPQPGPFSMEPSLSLCRRRLPILLYPV